MKGLFLPGHEMNVSPCQSSTWLMVDMRDRECCELSGSFADGGRFSAVFSCGCRTCQVLSFIII